MQEIEAVRAAENNLKNISLKIPKKKPVVFAGVSGSGKNSLVFDTVAVESARQWQLTLAGSVATREAARPAAKLFFAARQLTC